MIVVLWDWVRSDIFGLPIIKTHVTAIDGYTPA